MKYQPFNGFKEKIFAHFLKVKKQNNSKQVIEKIKRKKKAKNSVDKVNLE